ncbi:50S ribosomal protein L4 [Candidatus Dependentiae bacterium]|nr:50S ribosomal protein L4 [Candidatus Dependentiae bacterium]
MTNNKSVQKEEQSSTFKILRSDDINLTDEHRATTNKEGYSQCVRSLLQNWRQGTVGCKGRSDVSLSNKKPWKQKGTGRARAGSARSPLWRGGGVIFGPQPRTRTLSVSKHLRKNVCNTILWNYLDNNTIVSLDWKPADGAPKTSQAYNALKQAGIQNKNIIFFVSPEDSYTHTAFANIPNVRMLLYDQWNVYDISNGEMWLVLQKDMDAFKEMVNLWL